MTRIGFVTWDRDIPSGGNTYNECLIAALRAAGETVVVHRVPGPWPAGDPESHARMAGALGGESLALIDGIVGSGAPSVLAATTARAVLLVHMPITDDPGLDAVTRRHYAALERASLQTASAVLSPSQHAADELRRRYALTAVHVVPPGVTRRPLARGSWPPRLLVLGAVTPLKNPLAVLAALGDLDVTVEVVGPLEADPGYAARVVRAADARVRVRGTLQGDDLAAVWAGVDLLVHAARSETYGLVVAEALAHGVPALVPAGTGAEEALGHHGAGMAYPPDQLADCLRRWRGDADLREQWRVAARRARDRLPGWDRTAARVREVLADLSG